jgi:glycosyltransferase involved in cell wall biosynthesis
MKIAFLLGYDPKKYITYAKSSHLGVMRPFVNWAKALGERSVLAFCRCPDVLRGMEDFAPLKSTIASSDNIDELAHILNRNSVDYLISDDYVPRVRFLLKMAQKANVRKGVYVQLLYGMHTLMQNFSKDALDFKSKLVFSIFPLIPFRLLSRRYCDLLKKFDTIVANSRFTASLLRYLYGVEVNGVVYPPVDGMVFRPHLTNGIANEVIIYCGSNAGDTDPTLLKQLLELLISSNSIDKINLFGNKAIYHLLGKLVSSSMINIVQGISDMELAQMYSKSILTISPQEWETFGYVPIESMLCGTPVLAFASQPFSELVQDKNIAHLVYSRKALLEKLKELLTDMDCLRLMKQECFQRREDLLNNVSQTHSSDRLLSVLG